MRLSHFVQEHSCHFFFLSGFQLHTLSLFQKQKKKKIMVLMERGKAGPSKGAEGMP